MSPLLCPIGGGFRSESEGDSSPDSTCIFHVSASSQESLREDSFRISEQNPSSSPDRDNFVKKNDRTRKYRLGHGYIFRHSVVVWALLASILAATGSFLAEARPAAKPVATWGTLRIAKGRSIIPPPTQQQPSLYAWGNFGHLQEPQPLAARVETKLRKLAVSSRDSITARWGKFVGNHNTLSKCFALSLRLARTWVFWFFSKDCLASIYEDRWHAERNPDAFFGNEGMWVSKGGHKDVVRKRIQRSKRNRQWVGLGYTPRLVWLVGVLLRGTFQCTSIPKVFNPCLTGWGAGTILGAKCTHQEWIATFMIGWFGSEYYWTYLFGCNGPPYAQPGFEGIPVFITKIRNIRP